MWFLLLLSILPGAFAAKQSRCPAPPSSTIAGQGTSASSSVEGKVAGYVDGSIDASIDRTTEFKSVILSQGAFDRATDFWQYCVAYEGGLLPESAWLQYLAARQGAGLAVEVSESSSVASGGTPATSATAQTQPPSGGQESTGVLGAVMVTPRVVFYDFKISPLEVFIGGAAAGSVSVGESMYLPSLTSGAHYDLIVRWTEASGFMDLGEPVYKCRDIRIKADDKLHSIRAADMGAVRTCAPAAGPSAQETLMRMMDD